MNKWLFGANSMHVRNPLPWKIFFLVWLLTAGKSGQAATPPWSREPFAIQAGGQILDTKNFDIGGHAAPFLVDLDGDGNRDLVVGSIRGGFQFYRNIGTDAAPAFERTGASVTAEGHPAQIENWCCMAAAPQFVDVDKDGKLDLTAGSYGGPVYWFKAVDGTEFKLPHQLLSFHGVTILAHLETFHENVADSYAANVAWVLWNEDEEPDLLLGNSPGELFVWNADSGESHYTPPGVPIYSRASLSKEQKLRNELLINGRKVLPEEDRHSAPAVADWDGDGLFDILLGSMSGRVFLLRNTGRPGAPQFGSRELLVDGGKGMQWLRPGQAPLQGIRSQVHAADYNLDGRMDLLVGSFSQSWVPRTDLTRKERKELQIIRGRIDAINRQVGNLYAELSSKFSPFYEQRNKALQEEMRDLEKQAAPCLMHVEINAESSGRMHTYKHLPYHGTVWVYLRR